ncbi:hypothetical protein Peur_007768 [Populus x canadensis]
MWFPSHERASAVGISLAGFHRGNVVGLLLTPIMLPTIGFSGPFVLFSSPWLTRWAKGVTSDPRDGPFVSKSKLRLIQAGKTDSPANNSGQLPPLTSPIIKRTKLQGYFVLLSWMPIYFNTVFNVNLKQAAWFSAVPWGTMAISGYIAGSIGFFGPGVSLLCLNYAKTPVAAAVLMTIISAIGTGYFVELSGSSQAFLRVTAGLYFVTAIFWNLFATGERVF